MIDIKETFKNLISSPPTDVLKEGEDSKQSTLELVIERDIEGTLTREIGSANLFLASAFLSTINGFNIPVQNKEEIEKLAILWRDTIKELKEEDFIREKPARKRESFKVV